MLAAASSLRRLSQGLGTVARWGRSVLERASPPPLFSAGTASVGGMAAQATAASAASSHSVDLPAVQAAAERVGHMVHRTPVSSPAGPCGWRVDSGDAPACFLGWRRM